MEPGSRSIYELYRRRRTECNHDSDLFAFSSKVCGKLYGRLNRSRVTGSSAGEEEGPLGSVFNLEFSPDNRYAVAVFAGRAFELHDPRVRGKLLTRRSAHDDCVNCVTFTSDHHFATCSDDTTVRLWDSRNLRQPLAVLYGHQNWVKNIEYDAASGLLFSVAFQDHVRFWDLKKPEPYADPEGNPDNIILTLTDPVRMRLAPNSSKMLVTSRRQSQCFIVSDFDGCRIAEPETRFLYGAFISNPQNPHTLAKVRNLSCNKPSIHKLCGGRRRRIVMSVAFHWSGDFVGMRFTDFASDHVHVELTSLYDLREGERYTHWVTPELSQQSYLCYVDDKSPEDTKDFIKEICFSGNGRILASPHHNGVRILAVDPHCTAPDLYFDPRYHSQLKSYHSPDFEQVISLPDIHSSPVLTCRFAHSDCILATGAIGGSIAFTTPQL